jgi:hypothetical protein
MMNGHVKKGVAGQKARKIIYSQKDPANSSPEEEEKSSEESDVGDESVPDEVGMNGQHGRSHGASSVSDSAESVDGDHATDTEVSTQSSDEGSEIDTVTFLKQYAALTKAAKRLGTDLDIAEDFEGGSIMVMDNVEDGEKLAARIGYDPSKAITAFTHTLAIVETANRNVKKCGNTSSLFSIERYLDVIQTLSEDHEGEYSSEKAHDILDQDSRCHCEGYSFVSMQGVIEFSKDFSVVIKPKKQNTRLAKSSFDETVVPTQHEVVNSQVLKRQTGAEDDSLSKSRKQAEQLEKLCSRSRKPAIGVFEYGRAGADGAQNFIKQVFDAAVMTRDGYAEFIVPATADLGTRKADLLLKAAQPPNITEEGFDLNRSQYVLSLNAKTIKALFKSSNGGVANGAKGFNDLK